MTINFGQEEGRQNNLLLGRLRTVFGEKRKIDITATKDSCGILKGENGNLPKLFKSLLFGLIDFERKAFGQMNTTDKEKIDDLSDLAETVSFLSRILYLDPSEKDDSFLKRYLVHKRVSIYAPKSHHHQKEIYPVNDYNFLNSANIETEITDTEKNKKLVFGAFPVIYSFYPGAVDMVGAEIEDAKSALYDRYRSAPRGQEDIIKTISQAEKTLVNPYFYVRLQTIDNQTIFELKGTPKQKGDHVEVEFGSEKFPDYSIKFPLEFNLKDPKNEFAHLDLFKKQMVAFTKTLLETTLKDSKDLKRTYK